MSEGPSQDNLLDTILLDENRDILGGFILLLIGWLVALVNQGLGILIGIGIGWHFLRTFLHELSSGKKDYPRKSMLDPDRQEKIHPSTSAPITDEPTIAEKIKSVHIATGFKCPSCGATVLPTDVRCRHCGSVLVARANLPRPAKWSNVEIGRSVQLKHPEKGDLGLPVIHRIYYGELWQAQMKPDVPWTLTGDYYVGLGLANDIFLMNWQSRFYLLDVHQPLTDMNINRDFAPYARKFAASNQTRNVNFSYQEAVWEMFDIGRFRIEFAEGDRIRVGPGAVGRFIHARHDNNILVVEDYQSGGSGLDMLWIGYQVDEENIKM